jgi:hypothetical protein
MTEEDKQKVAAATSGNRAGIPGAGGEAPPKTLMNVGQDQSSVTSGSSSSVTTGSQRILGPDPKLWNDYHAAEKRRDEIASKIVQAQAEASRDIEAENQRIAYERELESMHQASIEAETQEKLAAINAKRDAALEAYQNGTVDPDRLWKNAGTAGQIGAALAVAFGAVAQGMKGGPNEAWNVIQGAIDRDVQLQAADIEKKRGEVGLLTQIGREVIAQGGDQKMAESAMRATAIQAAMARIQAFAARADAAMGDDGISMKATDLLAAGEVARRRADVDLSSQMRGQVSSQSTKSSQTQVQNTSTRDAYKEVEGQDPNADKPTFVLEDKSGNVTRYAVKNDKGVDPKEVSARAAIVNNLRQELNNMRKLYKDKLVPGMSPQFDAAVHRAAENISQLQKMGVLNKDEANFVEKTYSNMREGGDVIGDATAYAERAHDAIINQSDAVPVQRGGAGTRVLGRGGKDGSKHK